MGSVWQLTNRRHKALVEFLAAGGQEVDMRDYGTCLGSIVLDVTDITPQLRDSCRMDCPGYPEYDEYQKVRRQMGM
jgi:hypothetical protein